MSKRLRLAIADWRLQIYLSVSLITNYSSLIIHHSFPHSVLKLCTGFADAVLIV